MSFFFRRGHAGYSSQGHGDGQQDQQQQPHQPQGRPGGGGGGRRRLPSDPMPFCIDDAFDIPEDAELPPIIIGGVSERHRSALLVEEDETHLSTPILRNTQLRLDFPPDDLARSPPVSRGATGSPLVHAPGSMGTLGGNNGGESGSQDSASLIQGDKSGHGYYGGPAPLKYWWMHPKIRSNYKLVLAAVLLCLLGIALIIGGIVVYSLPGLQGVQALVFIIAGVICFLPGAYHIVYIYLAVKGKRGFEFNHLPLFNN